MKCHPIWRFVFINLKPFRWWLVAHFFVATFWAIDISLRPYLLKTIINRVGSISESKAIYILIWPVVSYMTVSFLMMVVFRIYDYIWLKLNSPLKRQLGDHLMKRMMMLSHMTLSHHFAGSLASQIKDVMSYVPDLCRLVITFYGHLMGLVIAIIAMSHVHFLFSLMLIVWVGVFVVGSLMFSKQARRLSAIAASVRSGVTGRMVDILTNMMVVRLFSTANFESKNLRYALDQYVEADQKRDWYFLRLFSFQGVSFIVYQALCLVWLIHSFKYDRVTTGDFVMILTINLSIVEMLWKISENISKLNEYVGSITQGLRLALAPLDIQDSPDAKRLQVTSGQIVFENVHFQYGDAKELFYKKSIVIEPGQKVGLVGYSGGGKSTFVNLILRLYDVTGGRILIDGQDIRNITQDSLRENIAMIPQDPSLFHRSLLENIRYGRVDAEDAEVLEAAKRAYAHDFIMDLVAGYGSLVGERGVKLSGGQRQRIAIARAILKNAPILILDEATSQLDSVTESHIQKSLLELMKDKTTLVIAHRLSTLLHMDRILVFEKGKIIEDGSHEELIAKGGLYKTLWNTQVGGFLPDKESLEI